MSASFPGASTQWIYAAVAGGIVNTTPVPIKAAAGAGVRNWLQAIELINVSAVATEITISDNVTVIWRGYLPATGANLQAVPQTIIFDPPIRCGNNTAINVACLTTATQTYVNARGFIGN